MFNRLLILVAALGISVAAGCDPGAEGGIEMPGLPDAGSGGKAGPDAGTGGAQGTGGMVATDAGAIDTGKAPDALPKDGGGAGGAGGTKVDAGGAAGSGGASGAGGAKADAGTPPAEPMFCAQLVEGTHNGCGYLGTNGGWEFLWKDGKACGNCDLKGKPVSGCKVPQVPDMTSNPAPQPTELLCVANCRVECCTMRAGSSCTSDANCCGTMRCKAKAGSPSKTCQ